MVTVRIHDYIRDALIRPDWTGEGRCEICGLPQTNRHHRREPVRDETSSRILGEGAQSEES